MAHIAYFHQEFQKRRWLDEDMYARIVALREKLTADPDDRKGYSGLIDSFSKSPESILM
jgi:hypothetical protein